MHDQSHAIIRLAVHLPGQNTICFHVDRIDQTIQNMDNKRSTLMAWFELNQNDPAAREFLYHQIPEHYVYKKVEEMVNGKKVNIDKWKPRKQGGHKVIGRMYTVGIKDGEKYYLRLLLLHVKGATSFESLRTIDDIVCPTFQEACKRRGLLETDDVWRETLEDAILVSMPYQLRQMFAIMCVYSGITSPPDLWNEFKHHFIEDYCHKLGHTPENCNSFCEDFALRELLTP